MVHLDHTTARGGAEMALVRLLRADRPWNAVVLHPAAEDEDVFAHLPEDVPRHISGVRQEAGASTSSRIGALRIGAQLLKQAALTKAHPAVRRSDLVVANSTRAAAYGAIALRGSSKPFVVHLRDIVSVESLGRFGHRMMTQVILPRADGVVANSNATLASAEPFLGPHAVRAVVPSASGLRVSGRRRTRPAGPLRFGILARIDPWKGQLMLLDAFAQAFPSGEEHLDIAGGAPFRHDDHIDELRARAVELGISDRVRLLGQVDDVQGVLDGWDVGIQASLRPEPMGQNVLQYLSSGLVTIVAGEGGPVEWVTDGVNGVVVPPRDVDALATALRTVAADPQLRRRLSAEASLTPGLLDDDKVARLHAQVYEAVARGTGLQHDRVREPAQDLLA
ncbi:glycosyltransferase family 4 protein [Microbacterium bovistercoris]|uniref:glycosyltransferase family 4 protein n=1 Tax=Microbacterium bovistercoris TaxID=2293570 RepID=UPI0015F294B3|nr:glycosyltransferase family 4 protein [Microbacterium bovistercoris]